MRSYPLVVARTAWLFDPQLVPALLACAEDLAELSVDEMVELGFDAKWATKMILEARKPWFEAENESEQG